MNPKKRLKMSLNGERVDRPPCICPGGMMNMVTAELMERVGIYLPEAPYGCQENGRSCESSI